MNLQMLAATNEEVTQAFSKMSHRDLIHQAQFDHYGRRLATCSADSMVNIWDRLPNGTWNKTTCWKVHGGPVWRVIWAHPQYGQVIATCSNDRSVYIWEEIIEGDGRKRWVKKAYLSDSRTAVTDIQFCPHQLGIMLAACTSQGIVRVYECPDYCDLSQWTLLHEMSPFDTRCSSLSWSTNQALRPLLIVGTDDDKMSPEERIVFYELNDNVRKWQCVPSLRLGAAMPVHDVAFSPAVATLGHQLAIAAGDVHMYSLVVKGSYAQQPESSKPTEYLPQRIAVLGDLKQVWRLSWNVTGTALTAASGDGTIRVWKSIYYDEWKLISSMNPLDSAKEGRKAPSRHMLSARPAFDNPDSKQPSTYY